LPTAGKQHGKGNGTGHRFLEAVIFGDVVENKIERKNDLRFLPMSNLKI